jgi:ATPase components of ABC transporters with duplicated ATPase domains
MSDDQEKFKLRNREGDRKSDRLSRDRSRHKSRGSDRKSSSLSSSDESSSSSRERDKSRHRRRRSKRDSSKRKDRSRSRRDRDKERKHGRKKKRRRRYSTSSSSSDSSDSSSEESSDESTSNAKQKTVRKVINQRLLEKLSERGETLEERERRRAERRAARITAKFGYTSQDNPFNDPNLAETFTWKKKIEVQGPKMNAVDKKKNQHDIINEIEKVRRRRREYEEQKEEMERIRAEESKMKELENYDEWARKEEEFHLQQQRQRSAIRLVEGREKPIDVLAKNLLMFGLSEVEKKDRAKVKYQEKYNAMDELENLEVELEEPHVFLKDLKLAELKGLLADIEAFQVLERDAGDYDNVADNSVLQYWNAMALVTKDEIQNLTTSRSSDSGPDVKVEIQKMFEGQSRSVLQRMREDVEAKVQKCIAAGGHPVVDEKDGSLIDMPYWQEVLNSLIVHLAKMDLSEIHSKMLVRQLEHLERKRKELARTKALSKADEREQNEARAEEELEAAVMPKNVTSDFGKSEEELCIADEVDLGGPSYRWQDKFRPRKPRYFNRVKTGYDWNKYNQTHYDHDNPPPKTVQGYKFNIFYPDLIDKTKTPKYYLEPTKSKEYCIIRFSAGPPYEDIAFKIINREWNKSRNRGFKCTFERGVLSLYFSFKTHWYRK